MAKMSKKTVSFIIIFVCIAVISAINLFKGSPRPDPAKSVAARNKGNPNAVVQIVEFVDFQCSFCAQGAKFVRDVFGKHPNDILLEVRYYPLSSHIHGFESARYVECAAQQGKFWDYEEKLFDRQSQWAVLADATPVLEMIAKDAKLDLPWLKACLKDKKVDEIIQKSRAEGDALGVKSTPTFFVNGKIAVGTNLLNQELTKYFNVEKKN